MNRIDHFLYSLVRETIEIWKRMQLHINFSSFFPLGQIVSVVSLSNCYIVERLSYCSHYLIFVYDDRTLAVGGAP